MIATTSLDPIKEALDRLESGIGPRRILVNADGEAHSPAKLGGWRRHTHCVLIRQDGWTLGCKRDLYEAARELWPREWIAVVAYANTDHRVTIKFAR